MIMIIIMSIMTSTILFTMISHPLTMGMTLLIQTLLIALITGLMSPNFWFSYILFMIMIGGMLVLFIYMTSIASNEKFQYSNMMSLTITLMSALTMIILLMDSLPEYLLTKNFLSLSLSPKLMFNLALSKYLNLPLSSLMITMIIYLLITLIAVVKITNIMYGPLRQKM